MASQRQAAGKGCTEENLEGKGYGQRTGAGRMKKHVLIIYTGGTIGMARTAYGYAPQGEGFHTLLNTLPELRHPAMPSWEVVDMNLLLDSSNITVREWNTIGRM